jgi:pectate lyase
MIKYCVGAICVLFAVGVFVYPGQAATLVNDTWQDATRSDPASPTYSENGTDLDSDGDLESAWFASASANLISSTGHLVMSNNSTASTSYTTYIAPGGSSLTLAGVGDTLRVTWIFSLLGADIAANGSQNMRLALVNGATRLTSDSSPPNQSYAGYALFLNMGTITGRSTPFQLLERSNAGSSDILATSGNWTSLANAPGFGNGAAAYTYGGTTLYTNVWTVTLLSGGNVEINVSITGGNLNGAGSASCIVTDSTPNTLSYDTFALRPSSGSTTAEKFDTRLFRVELIPGATAPTIDSNPDDQTVFEGQNASFAVFASGTAPLMYQWYFNTNSPLAGATNSTLTIPNAQTSDAGGYSALVSNAYGSVTSAVAQLTVNLPVAPTILSHPQNQTNVPPGGTAAFSVVAGGSEPLTYQWYFNTSTLLPGATEASLTITNVQVGNAGDYHVVVSNVAGTAISSNAVLTVNTNPVPPVFTSQPASQVVLIGATASFSAVAAGTAPISYQWSKGGVPMAGATSSTLTLTNVQSSDAGTYTLTASNSVGTATSDPAVLTVSVAIPVVNSAYNLVGFAQGTTGGGIIATNDPAYKQVYTPLDLAQAIRSANKTANSVKVIEIMNDLDLGWNEIGAAVQSLDSTPFRSHTTPLLHPKLLVTGVSLIDIKAKSPLTIFSANGATIRHANFNIKSTGNIIVRNLRFDELWEWDESSKGDYDRNDWDFITLGNAGTVSNIWIDHCTFTKSYDGIVDMKQGSYNITISWCKYTGDDGATNPSSFVWQQIDKLESNKSAYAMYNFLRTRGFSTTNIATIIQGGDKCHLIGALSLNSENAQHKVTFHHDWFLNPWDRLPRLRAGNVHNYNLYVDDTLGLAARRLRDAIAATLSTTDQNTLNNTYNFRPFLNGSISTENGAVLVEKSVYKDCLWPLRNNQTDPSNPIYTGKIMALDTIYQFDSTTIRGNSTDPGNPLGPFQAPVIAFSWNLPGNVLPYSYTMDDPSQLLSILQQGAGAGVLTWNKTNWLATSYAPTAPFIVTDPQSQTVAASNNVTFTVVAGGSAPLTYQWYFNTNSPIAGATNTALTIVNVQTNHIGVYSVVASNSAGTTTSAYATLSLTSTLTAFESWQFDHFGCTNCPQAAANADPDGDGMDNQSEFLAGTSPTNSASAFRVSSTVPQGDDIVITWTTAGGRTNRVQVAGGGDYSTNGFADLSGPIIIAGTGDVATNYVDVGGATNRPSRFYRVRLAP